MGIRPLLPRGQRQVVSKRQISTLRAEIFSRLIIRNRASQDSAKTTQIATGRDRMIAILTRL
jgi:hypothetical protein